MLKKSILTALMIFSLADISAKADGVGELGILDTSRINPATGTTWAAGDTYRLIFVTSGATTATSTDIATYNAFVQGIAEAAGLGGATWNVVGSTATVDAKDNTGTNPATDGTGGPIVLMDGKTVIADNYADLWDGINVFDGDVYGESPDDQGRYYTYGVHLDENGVKNLSDRIFTGSNPNGTASSDNDRVLGGSAEQTPRVQTGRNHTPEGYYPTWKLKGNAWMVDWSEPTTTHHQVYAVSETLTVQENYPDVDAGHDWITWSGQPVLLDPTVVNNDTQMPQRNLVCVWDAEGSGNISITEDGSAPDDTATPQAVVMITKSPGSIDPAAVTLTLSVTLEGVVTLNDTVTIDVYDNSCKAAEANGMEAAYSQADFNKDCFVDVKDLALMAAVWLDDYSIIEF